MKQQIYFYKLFLFGRKEKGDFLALTQVQGQQLSMILTTDATRKFITIGEDVINTSAIESLVRCPAMKSLIDYSKSSQERQEPEIRELTAEEESSQRKFLEFKSQGKKLLS